MAKFYSARSKTISPLPWLTFALPVSNYVYIRGGHNIKIGSIVKRQLRLGPDVRGATIIHQPMGRFDGAGVGSVLPLDVESGATFIRYGKSNPSDDSDNFESGGLIWQTEQGWYARYMVSVADDAVHTWVRPDGSNTRSFKARVWSRNKAFHIEAYMNWVVPAGYEVASWDSASGGDAGLTASVDTNGGVYSGTTGVDGRITLSVQGGNTFYLENRSGGAEELHVELMG